MKMLVRLVLGIILIYAGISRQEIFYRIRGIPLKGAGTVVMRIVYIAAGVLLLIL